MKMWFTEILQDTKYEKISPFSQVSGWVMG
jgi:hypothetical protein